jgi:hypothetical protein
MTPATPVKFAVVAEYATVIAEGTVSPALLLDSTTATPPDGAGLLKLTVQAVVPPEPTFVGVHTREEITTGATNEIVALAELVL